MLRRVVRGLQLASVMEVASRRQTSSTTPREPIASAVTAPLDPPKEPTKSDSLLQTFYKKLAAVETMNDTTINQSARSKKKREMILKERSEMLQFRDMRNDFDRVIIRRDSVQMFKFFYLGKDYAIDVELERNLRYFKEHAVKELYSSFGMKMYCGLDRLSTVAGSVLFPAIAAANCAQFFVPTAAGAKPGTFLKSSGVKLGSGDEEETTISPMFFKKPTIVLIGPLGTSATHEIESMWREMYVEFIIGNKMKKATSQATKDGAPPAEEAPKITTEDVERIARDSKGYVPGTAVPYTPLLPADFSRKPSVEFITIRDIEVKYKIVHNIVMKRTCCRFPYQLMEKTYVGHKVVDAFFQYTLPLRNPRATYVLLVDHRGNIRWTSSGPPNLNERKWLPALLQQLVVEQLKDSL